MFGLAYERAVLAWFDEMPADVRGRDDHPGSG